MEIGKLLIFVGLVTLCLGVIFLLLSKLGLGHLPGDIAIERENFRFYFPLATCILVSIVISAISYFFFGQK